MRKMFLTFCLLAVQITILKAVNPTSPTDNNQPLFTYDADKGLANRKVWDPTLKTALNSYQKILKPHKDQDFAFHVHNIEKVNPQNLTRSDQITLERLVKHARNYIRENSDLSLERNLEFQNILLKKMNDLLDYQDFQNTQRLQRLYNEAKLNIFKPIERV